MLTEQKRLKIVCLGGGTGTYTVLTGLKRHAVDLSAVVSIADNGGSTGVLRDELGILPPGDIRQCLVALSEGQEILRNLFMFRFDEGSMDGHNLGNLFMAALQKLTGDPLEAVRQAQSILKVRGRVIPVAPVPANLYAVLKNGEVLVGETVIDQPTENRSPIRRCYLQPEVRANPEALQAIMAADIIVIGPGDLYTSLVPVLLVSGVAEAIKRSKAHCLYVLNLVTRMGQTIQYSALNFCETLTSYSPPDRIDAVLVNDAKPSSDILQLYMDAGEGPVVDDLDGSVYRTWRGPLISDEIVRREPGDVLVRSLLRHDPERLAAAILQVYAERQVAQPVGGAR